MTFAAIIRDENGVEFAMAKGLYLFINIFEPFKQQTEFRAKLFQLYVVHGGKIFQGLLATAG